MIIVGFLQNYNNVENGFLTQCLYSMRRICDEVVVYDDGSTENVRDVYKDFGCITLNSPHNEFSRELYHKHELLSIAMRMSPDWICWFDTDAILGRHWEDRGRTEESLMQTEEQGIALLHLHNLNLWRSDTYYRIDNSFNDLWHGVFWKNTGQLHYRPIGKLHQKQYPHFYHDDEIQTVTSQFPEDSGKLLHFGFASDDEIAKKYFAYRDQGQHGWALDRLVTEKTECDLVEAKEEWFPEWYLNEGQMDVRQKPVPIFDPEEMGEYGSYGEWKERE